MGDVGKTENGKTVAVSNSNRQKTSSQSSWFVNKLKIKRSYQHYHEVKKFNAEGDIIESKRRFYNSRYDRDKYIIWEGAVADSDWKNWNLPFSKS